MSKLKMPWTKRAEETEKALEDDELRVQSVKEDWENILLHKSNIDREVNLNDWTRTVSHIFAGKHARASAVLRSNAGKFD